MHWSQCLFTDCLLFSSCAGYTHNPYNGVIYNDTILATGVFSSKELWRLSKSKSLVFFRLFS